VTPERPPPASSRSRSASTTFVQRTWHHERNLHVHGWVYGLHEGLLRDPEVDPEHAFDGIEIHDHDGL
jgi:hypothetical protein